MFRIPDIIARSPQTILKYFLLSTTLLYASYCYLFDVSLASSNLPNYTGPYDVGTVDIEVPLGSRRRKIHDATFKKTGLPAFELETILFSLFYPADEETTSRHPQHTWISKPLSLRAEGYARLARIDNYIFKKLLTFALWAGGGIVRIPAKVDVPLLVTTDHLDLHGKFQNNREKPTQFPVVIFSHGFATSRNDYSQFCGDLASRGYIVAALEHRDGSGPGSLLMNDRSRPILPILLDQLQTPDPTATPLTKQELKRIQLLFRQTEVSELIHILHALNTSPSLARSISHHNPLREGATLLPTLPSRLDLAHLTVAGHSYGATLALQCLHPDLALPIKAAVILDPGKNSGPLNDVISVPTLIIHSHSWSKSHSIFPNGRPHFDTVRDLAKAVKAPAWFLTSRGTSHVSVCDAPLIQPWLLRWTTGAKVDVREGVEEYVRVVEEFLRFVCAGGENKGLEKVKGILEEGVTHPRFDEDGRGEERKDRMGKMGVGREWQVHVSPVEG